MKTLTAQKLTTDEIIEEAIAVGEATRPANDPKVTVLRKDDVTYVYYDAKPGDKPIGYAVRTKQDFVLAGLSATGSGNYVPVGMSDLSFEGDAVAKIVKRHLSI